MFSFCELKIVLNSALIKKSILLVEKNTVLVFFAPKLAGNGLRLQSINPKPPIRVGRDVVNKEEKNGSCQ